MNENVSLEIENFYDSIGLGSGQLKAKGDSFNIFKVLGFEPKFDENGERVLTPYEILGVLPQFSGGKERPIVFAIKNRVRKIGRYEGEQLNFVYKPGRIKAEKTILSTLKTNYKRAVFQGNQDQADSILESIEALTGKSASEVMDSFYDYSRYYRKMKKQLLIDMFAHFFLMYLRASVKSVRKGIVYKNRSLKPFKENSRAYLESTDEMGETEYVPIIDPAAFGLGNMQKIVVNDNEGNVLNDISFVDEKGSKTSAPSVKNYGASFSETQNQSNEQPKETKSNDSKEIQPNENIIKTNIDEKEDIDFARLFSRKSFIKRKKRLKTKAMGMPQPESELQEKIDTLQADVNPSNINANEFGFEV